MTEAEQCHNTDNPVRLGTNQTNTEVQTPECVIQVTSSKIIEITHEKQNPSGQTNSINSLQGKLKQQGSKMTSLKDSEDNAQDSDQSEQNTAYQSNQNIYEKKEKQRICEIHDSGETEGNTQENHLYEKKQQRSNIRNPEEGKGNTQDPDKEPDSSNQDNVCPTCTKTVRTGVQCGIL